MCGSDNKNCSVVKLTYPEECSTIPTVLTTMMKRHRALSHYNVISDTNV